MPIQVYSCPEHGVFEVPVPVNEDVPPFLFCCVMMPDSAEHTSYTQCGEPSDWVPSVPNFIGGPTTGAGKE